MRALSLYYQNAHWLSKGDNFYSDHKLWERIYKKSVEEVDKIAEKAVGFGFENVPAIEGLGLKLTPEEITIQQIMEKEVEFLNLLQTLEPQAEHIGVQNLFEDLADSHEENLYLLRRRAAV
jgi:DNA-binding ferritin-like protein